MIQGTTDLGAVVTKDYERVQQCKAAARKARELLQAAVGGFL